MFPTTDQKADYYRLYGQQQQQEEELQQQQKRLMNSEMRVPRKQTALSAGALSGHFISAETTRLIRDGRMGGGGGEDGDHIPIATLSPPQ